MNPASVDSHTIVLIASLSYRADTYTTRAIASLETCNDCIAEPASAWRLPQRSAL
jgi:hypothetical protein